MDERVRNSTVDSLDLSVLGLQGLPQHVLPKLFRSHSLDHEDLSCTLTSVNLSGNQLTVVPDLTAIAQLHTLDVSNNKLGAVNHLEHLNHRVLPVSCLFLAQNSLSSEHLDCILQSVQRKASCPLSSVNAERNALTRFPDIECMRQVGICCTSITNHSTLFYYFFKPIKYRNSYLILFINLILILLLFLALEL